MHVLVAEGIDPGLQPVSAGIRARLVRFPFASATRPSEQAGPVRIVVTSAGGKNRERRRRRAGRSVDFDEELVHVDHALLAVERTRSSRPASRLSVLLMKQALQPSGPLTPSGLLGVLPCGRSGRWQPGNVRPAFSPNLVAPS
jgi:hypothetical protein